MWTPEIRPEQDQDFSSITDLVEGGSGHYRSQKTFYRKTAI
jgi:hypothetical protein